MATSKGGHVWNPVYYERGMVFRTIASNKRVFVAAGDSNLLWASRDGINWKVKNPNVGPRHNTFAVVFGDKFVAVGSRGFIMTSESGTRGWTAAKSRTGEGLWGVTYGNGLYVACGNKGVVLTSPDGISWTNRGNITSERLQSIAFGSGMFVAGGSNGSIFTSADGISWKKRSRAELGIIALAFGGGTFVAGGRKGMLYSSTDGKTWTKRESGTRYYIWGLTYCDSGFVAVGGYGLAMTSPDGKSWTIRNSKAHTTLMGVAAKGGTLVAAGLARSLVISYGDPDTESPFLRVNSPNRELTLEGGTKEKITWTGINIDQVRLEYSIDGGDRFSNIRKSAPNNGLFEWSVPDVTSSECLIRVSKAGNRNIADVSDVPFSITGHGSSASSITVTAPAAGESLAAGSTYEIAWTGSKKYETVDIEYNDGSQWVELVNGVPDTGKFSWTVPDISTPKARLWMKGKASDGNAVDYSDGFFTIVSSGEGEGEGEVGERQNHSFKFNGTVNLSFIPGDASSIKLEFVPDE